MADAAGKSQSNAVGKREAGTGCFYDLSRRADFRFLCQP
jgi:hypothetical protein